MKFICDHMLFHVGRWLRVAGYDTKLADAALDDPAILEIALTEGRTLLTSDRSLLNYRRSRGMVVWLPPKAIDHCMAELNRQITLNWLYLPFSRCLLCNERLTVADASAGQRVPEKVRHLTKGVHTCPTCQRIYWQGTHVDQMWERLRAWKKENDEFSKTAAAN